MDWNTLLAAIRFSMYWPNTWFSDFSFRFSSLTESTLDDRSIRNKTTLLFKVTLSIYVTGTLAFVDYISIFER